MPELIYSRCSPGVLTHVVARKGNLENDPKPRRDLVPDDQFLQVATLQLGIGDTFQAHKHIPNERTVGLTQEIWIIVAGGVVAYLFDLDDQPLGERHLEVGDSIITLRGGHNYKAVFDGTLVYEVKVGPYLGRDGDKVPLSPPDPPNKQEVFEANLNDKMEIMQARELRANLPNCPRCKDSEVKRLGGDDLTCMRCGEGVVA